MSRSWHDNVWLFEQLAFASEGDALLLIEDAVLAAQSPLTLASFLAKCESRGVAAFVLQDDMQLRGISNQYTNLQPIDYAGFVDLTENYERQVAW